jgi:predicted Zn-dependent protease with MMP-like domain
LIFSRHKLCNQTNDKPASFKRERKVARRREGGERISIFVFIRGLGAAASAEVEATLIALPEPLRACAEKLPVTFERQPSMGLRADGIEFDTLGLFTGPEFAHEEDVPLPPQIILFLENIWEFAESDEKIFGEEIRTTFLHELGHYLGLDEDGLTERELD